MFRGSHSVSFGDLSGTSGMIFVNLSQKQAMGGPLATEWLESSELCGYPVTKRRMVLWTGLNSLD